MKKLSLASLVIISAPLLAVPALAFTAIDKTIVKNKPSGAVAPVQGRKHCKSKQSICHALRHNF